MSDDASARQTLDLGEPAPGPQALDRPGRADGAGRGGGEAPEEGIAIDRAQPAERRGERRERPGRAGARRRLRCFVRGGEVDERRDGGGDRR